MASPSVEQRVIRELSRRGTCSLLDLKSALQLSRGDIMGITTRLADRRSVRIEKDHQGAHISYTWTGPKEKAPGGKSSLTKKPPHSPTGSAPPAQAPVRKAASPKTTWKTEAVKELKGDFGSSNKVVICYQRFIERLGAPDMDAVVKEIGPENLRCALFSCFWASPESDEVFGSESPNRPDAYDMCAAAKKAVALATFVAKYKISNTDFVDALNSFSLRMDEGAISHGRPRRWAGGYAYGGIILPRQQGKGKRINPEVWDLVKTLERYFRQNLKNHPRHRAIAVLCSVTFGKKYTEGNIKKILERWKKKSARPLLDPNIRDSLKKVT